MYTTNTEVARIFVLRGALKLEVKGMKRRGRSAYSIVKEEFGFKGSKKKVLEQLNQWIKENLEPKESETNG